MSKDLSKKELIQNEQKTRNRNSKIKDGIKKFFRNTNKVNQEPLSFICECSDLDCKKYVKISISDYEKIHKQKNSFIIAKGHKTPSVEKVVAEKSEFQIVKKPNLSP